MRAGRGGMPLFLKLCAGASPVVDDECDRKYCIDGGGGGDAAAAADDDVEGGFCRS